MLVAWCRKQDSNRAATNDVGDPAQRVATRLETRLRLLSCSGAGNRIRTYDLRITNAPLYQLSYSGEGAQF